MANGPRTEPAVTPGGGPSPEEASPQAQAAPTTRRRRLKRSTRIALLVIVLVALIAGGAFAVSYFLNASRYVSTDNAQIDGDQISITAPATGTLVDWHATVGSTLSKDQPLGRIEIPGGFVQPQMTIRAPAQGTIVVVNGVQGGFVASGTQLAVAYELSKIFVTARVDETNIQDVHPGQKVDIDVDAYPGVPLIGYVREIQGGAAAVFSLFPQSNSNTNFQKVGQVIPVRIGLVDQRGLDLVPGMSVTAHIHKK
jgi:multidrug resistance efflux pump